MQRFAERCTAVAALVIAAALCVLASRAVRHEQTPQTGTSYQSVALINGQLYFGKLGAVQDGYLELSDVFFVQTRQNPETKAVANVLVKRGNEPHQPDRMLINRQQVLLIEPVKAGSPIAQLIAGQGAAR